MKGEREWNSFLLRKIKVYNINYALLVRSQGVLSQIVAGCGVWKIWSRRGTRFFGVLIKWSRPAGLDGVN